MSTQLSQLPSGNASRSSHPYRRTAILAISIGLAAVLLFLALRSVSWVEMLQTLRQLRPEYLGLGFLFNSLTLFVRGQRWGVLVSARKRANPLDLFYASAIGYLGNTFLPARAGELLRSLVLGRVAEISASYVLATALTERFMDAIALVLIGALTIRSATGGIPSWLPAALQWMALAGGLVLVVFLFAWRLESLLQKILSGLHLPPSWHARLAGFLTQFLLGTQAFINPARAVVFVVLTAGIWLLDGTSTVLFAHGFNLTLHLGQALLFLSALGLSSALPSTPGYLGIYQFVAVSVMPVFGISPSQALTLVLAGQAVNVATILLWGLVGLGRFGIKIRGTQDVMKQHQG